VEPPELLECDGAETARTLRAELPIGREEKLTCGRSGEQRRQQLAEVGSVLGRELEERWFAVPRRVAEQLVRKEGAACRFSQS